MTIILFFDLLHQNITPAVTIHFQYFINAKKQDQETNVHIIGVTERRRRETWENRGEGRRRGEGVLLESVHVMSTGSLQVLVQAL